MQENSPDMIAPTGSQRAGGTVLKISDRHIFDPVHQIIRLPDICWKVIDTPHFQRLRNLKQLGSSYLVFPGGCHNRFEHSIGVAFLAGTLIGRLRIRQPELKITDSEVVCLYLAGLCHDLGHGPFSHLFDNIFIGAAHRRKLIRARNPAASLDPRHHVAKPVLKPRLPPPVETEELLKNRWTHEDGSVMLFRDVVAKRALPLTAAEVDFVAALILGDPLPAHAGDREFLYEIVANKNTSLDVDKFDYLQRDGRAVGLETNVGVLRLMESSRVIDGHICYNVKDAMDVYQVMNHRYSMYRRVYAHKTAKSIDLMIADALLAADDKLGISDAVHKPETYLPLSDHIMSEILQSKDPDLAEARSIFCRVQERDLYKLTDELLLEYKEKRNAEVFFTPEALAAHCEGEITEADLRVSFTVVDFGAKDTNPLSLVTFYSKNDIKCKFSLEEMRISHLMPQRFCEVIMRIYVTDKLLVKTVKNAVRPLIKQFLELHAPQGSTMTRTMVPDGDAYTPLRRKRPALDTSEISNSISPVQFKLTPPAFSKLPRL